MIKRYKLIILLFFSKFVLSLKIGFQRAARKSDLKNRILSPWKDNTRGPILKISSRTMIRELGGKKIRKCGFFPIS